MKALLNEVRAAIGGHPWAPCRLCGQMAGGRGWHPVDGMSAVKTVEAFDGVPVRGQALCQDCARAGKGDPRWLDSGGR